RRWYGSTPTSCWSSRTAVCYCVWLESRPPPVSPLFPYTTLFRSHMMGAMEPAEAAAVLDAPLLGTVPDFGGLRPAELAPGRDRRSEEHTSELQSRENLVCRLLLEKKNTRQVATVSAAASQRQTQS